MLKGVNAANLIVEEGDNSCLRVPMTRWCQHDVGRGQPQDGEVWCCMEEGVKSINQSRFYMIDSSKWLRRASLDNFPKISGICTADIDVVFSRVDRCGCWEMALFGLGWVTELMLLIRTKVTMHYQSVCFVSSRIYQEFASKNHTTHVPLHFHPTRQPPRRKRRLQRSSPRVILMDFGGEAVMYIFLGKERKP